MEKPQVLIIEDDYFLAEALKQAFERQDWDVTIAPDGKTGMLRASKKEATVILLDIMLPGEDGVTLLTMLKLDANTSAIPVVIVSTIGQTDVIEQCLNLGAAHYFVKGECSIHEIVRTVNELVSPAAA